MPIRVVTGVSLRCVSSVLTVSRKLLRDIEYAHETPPGIAPTIERIGGRRERLPRSDRAKSNRLESGSEEYEAVVGSLRIGLIRNAAKFTAPFRPGITAQIEDSVGSSRLQPTEKVSNSEGL